MVIIAGDDDLIGDVGEFAQERGQQDAPLLIWHDVGRAGKHAPAELAGVRVGQRQILDAIGVLLPTVE
jgi:hypothetical protein